MHILILPSWYPTRDDPIRGSFFAEQAEAMARHGHTVSVFPVYNDAPRSCRVEKTIRGNLTEYAVHVKPLRFHLTGLQVLRAMIRILRRMPAGERPEIIHVHSYAAARYARALKRLFGIPYVITEHVSWFERGILSPRSLREASRGYRAADAVIAVSAGLRAQIQPLCGDKDVLVVPNMVDERFLKTPLDRESREGFEFLSVGSLDPYKGHDVLLRAFALAAGDDPGLRLTICGDGPERQSLESQADELGLRERVTFTGSVSREGVAERLRHCGAFALSSRIETFGIVYLEAMACGRPIIMTKTGAWEQLAKPETGLAVDIDDVPALAEAMRTVVRCHDRYDPEVIRAYCRERFSPEAVCGQLTEIYQNLNRR